MKIPKLDVSITAIADNVDKFFHENWLLVLVVGFVILMALLIYTTVFALK